MIVSIIQPLLDYQNSSRWGAFAARRRRANIHPSPRYFRNERLRRAYEHRELTSPSNGDTAPDATDK